MVFVFGRRSDRLVPEILFRHLGRRSVLGLVTNDEIETRLGTRVVGIGRAAVAGEAVDRSRKDDCYYWPFQLDDSWSICCK